MEIEIIKHMEKILSTAKKRNQTFIKKAKEIGIEIFIIVFAITLSIWLHDWSEQNHEQKEVNTFLSDLKEDLNNDITNMQLAKDALQNTINNFSFLQQLSKTQLDSIEKMKGSLYYYSSVGTTKISNGDYEGFKSSGKIGLIKNKDLKRNILKYYQEVIPDILEAEKINAQQVLKLTDFWNENAARAYKTIFLDPKFKARVGTILSVNVNSVEQYENAISMAKKIIDKIRNQ